MTTYNIEQFDEIAGLVFARLYDSFPIPIYLDVGEYTGGKPLRISFSQFHETNSKEADMAYYTISWLLESGYINAIPHNSGGFWKGFSDVVLTAKGLETMKATPDSLTAPMGERIKDAVKQDGREVARSLVSQALSIGLALGVNALK
ncbi:hypothetical protein ACET9I_01430 [Aeromonas veronii]